MPKMATFRPPGAEKLIFSDKTLPCSIDCAPKPIERLMKYRYVGLGAVKQTNVLPEKD